MKTKRVSLAVKLLIVIFSVYAVFTLIHLQIQINAASQEQALLQEQLELKKLACAELQDAIQERNKEDYIVKIAWGSLGYVFPGEQDFVDISSK